MTNSHSRIGCFLASCRQTERHGSLYLSVLGVAMIVSAIGMSALTVARINMRSVSWRQDRREARILADAAIELGMGIVMQDANWRSSFSSGQENPATPMTMGNGTIAWKLVDVDGSLAGDISDTARLFGIGRVGQAVYTKSVLLEPSGVGLDCLTSALHAQGNLWINNSIDIITATGAPVSTNTQAKNWGVINGNLECDGMTGTGTLNGTLTDPLDPDKTLPGPNVFDYYLNNGTRIDISDLPLGTAGNAGKRMLEKVVVSPGNNPYGSGVTNPEGIYVIDCENQVLRIKLVRLVGTFVLLNPGSGSDIDNDHSWEPAARNFPVLLVDGDITFNWHSFHPLRESMALVNYNPAHTPYQGESDTDQTDDNYPSRLKGLIYVNGIVTVTNSCVIEGVVVIGNYLSMLNATIDVTYDSIFLDHPPPGFGSDNPMRLSSGSWRREVSE